MIERTLEQLPLIFFCLLEGIHSLNTHFVYVAQITDLSRYKNN